MTAATFLLGAGASALLMLASIGAGATILSLARLIGTLTRLEAVSWAFALGCGVVGWAMFFLAAGGLLDPLSLTLLAAASAGGVVLLRRAPPGPADSQAHGGGWIVLCLVLAAILAGDAMEALSPPADADTLAYHFALPKQFLAASRLEFVPRAVDGAVPLLVHMTYTAALALGGETALTLWTTLSGWMCGLLTYAVSRRHLGRSAALFAALIVLSAPVVLYGAGSGQVEIRCALFALAGTCAMARAVAERSHRFVALAGFGAGFFAGAKYTGVLFAAALAVPLLLRWRSPRALAVFAVATLIAGAQWYGWNWYHTGDPMFPALFRTLGLPDGPYWTAAVDQAFRTTYAAVENPLPRNPLYATVYPFLATLWPPEAIESGRTGFGPVGLLLLPFAAAGAWRFRHRLRESPLATFAVAAGVYYVLWYASGVSQRVRHLVPIWPIFVICLTVAAVRWTEDSPLRRPLVFTAAVTLALHLAAQAAFAIGYARYLFGDENRAAFLARNVPLSTIVPAVEAEMGPDDRVLVNERQLIYLFDRPVFYYHWLDQAQVRLEDAARRPAELLRTLRALKITLLLVPAPLPESNRPSELSHAAAALRAHGCADRLRTLHGSWFGSRTLRTAGQDVLPLAVYRLRANCSR